MPVTIDKVNKFVRLGPEVEFTAQDIVNAIRSREDDFDLLDEPTILGATGKLDSGGGRFTGIVVRILLPWKLKWDDEAGPATIIKSVIAGTFLGFDPVLAVVTQTPFEPSTFVSIDRGNSTDPALLDSGPVNNVADQLLGRSVIDPNLAGRVGDWIERHYDPANDTVEVARFELRDMAGVLITTAHNSTLDASVVIGQRIPIAFP